MQQMLLWAQFHLSREHMLSCARSQSSSARFQSSALLRHQRSRETRLKLRSNSEESESERKIKNENIWSLCGCGHHYRQSRFKWFDLFFQKLFQLAEIQAMSNQSTPIYLLNRGNRKFSRSDYWNFASWKKFQKKFHDQHQNINFRNRYSKKFFRFIKSRWR